jgi:type IV pilus assembly protein PilO
VKDWWTRIRAAFENLAPRERLLVGIAGGLLLVILAYAVVVAPILAVGDRIHQEAATAEQELEVMARLRREYDEVDRRLSRVEQQIKTGATGNVRTTLETMARESSVRIESMEQQSTAPNEKYRETRLAVTLESVTLAQTVAYLQRIENAPQLLSVKTLRMRTRPDKPELLDVSFSVSSFEPI